MHSAPRTFDVGGDEDDSGDGSEGAKKGDEDEDSSCHSSAPFD